VVNQVVLASGPSAVIEKLDTQVAINGYDPVADIMYVVEQGAIVGSKAGLKSGPDRLVASTAAAHEIFLRRLANRSVSSSASASSVACP
jgi:hypothetical protein